jgi:hypothetical protein
MRSKRTLVMLLCIMSTTMVAKAAITVAASNSKPEEKKKADILCDGKDDQIKLMDSLKRAEKFKTMIDIHPAKQQEIECYGRHHVVWFPGDYNLSDTLIIPDSADVIIDAQGTFFNYLPKKGDAVLVNGMNRCRYNFGTIKTDSTGDAIHVMPAKNMPALMSVISFMGLIGTGQKGVGLHLDHRYENVCVNNFIGTDVSGFDVGVLVDDIHAYSGENRPTVKSDTNWYWLSYVRMCNTCIWEKGAGIDCGYWEVNVDASIPGSTAIRTAGKYTQWTIIMGTWNLDKTHALILDQGAEHQIIEMRPPIDVFRWQDNSGNDTNVFLATSQLPYRKASDAEILSYWNRAGGVSGQHEQRKIEIEKMIEHRK